MRGPHIEGLPGIIILRVEGGGLGVMRRTFITREEKRHTGRAAIEIEGNERGTKSAEGGTISRV